MMRQRTIQIEELSCPSYINRIENALPKLDGVSEVIVKYHLDEVEVIYEESLIHFNEIEGVIRDLGFKISPRLILLEQKTIKGMHLA
ncbi:heavy metal-binding protein [Aquibacillus halophilus]|uniref:Heavy metal-binding protein n=1 Tax=Aquibacillus halophilus TaxID=930132 RepID=A0A6A8DJE4_9BACI|nr:heavy-metal-associated domain-containing protein [Aquibacillus halophilus]MRH43871.1 heavy metal-binding protein [Aquibacillus halophilus]